MQGWIGISISKKEAGNNADLLVSPIQEERILTKPLVGLRREGGWKVGWCVNTGNLSTLLKPSFQRCRECGSLYKTDPAGTIDTIHQCLANVKRFFTNFRKKIYGYGCNVFMATYFGWQRLAYLVLINQVARRHLARFCSVTVSWLW